MCSQTIDGKGRQLADRNGRFHPCRPQAVVRQTTHSGHGSAVYDATMDVSFLRGSTWPATLGLIVLLGALAAGAVYFQSGGTTVETGVIVRFGVPSDNTLVFVRMSDGRLLQVVTTPAKLRTCAVGRPIQLVRQGRVLRPAPFACHS